MSTSGPQVPQLTPGADRQMLAEALRYVATLPRDAAVRADAFEALAGQIETHTGGSWRATRGPGVGGSIVFLGRQGQAVVVMPDGGLFRGAIGRGVDITSAGLRPDPGTMTRLD